MIFIHDKAVRGRTKGALVDSYHTFSFGGFADPSRMGFGNLRVINEDTLIPGGGFAPHDHANMDILTYVTAGQIRHEDDQGNVAKIAPGEIQGMSAGTGVTHSEYNASDSQSARFLQIWLIPDMEGGLPSYTQAAVPKEGDILLAGPADTAPLIPLRSGTTLRLMRFAEGDTLPLPTDTTAHRFVHMLNGMALAESERVSAGDGLQIPAGDETELSWRTDGEALIFHMPLRSKPLDH